MSYLSIQYAADRQPASTFPAQLVAHLMPRPKPRNLLEIGFGRGDFLLAWNTALWPGIATGVDLEPSKITGTLVVDVERQDLPFSSDSFDVVFSKSLIEHLRDPERFLDEALRVLRPGGTLLLLSPDWRTYMRTFYDDYTHVRPYDQVSLADLLASRGFCEVDCERIWQYPPLWRHRWLRPLAWLWRWCVPVELSLWLSRWTGCGFFRWSSQLTLLATATKHEPHGGGGAR